MPVISTPQDPSWANNIYLLATTRAFALMGTAYLVRSLYNLLSSTWGSRPASVVAAAVSGLALEELNSNTLPAEPGVAATDPDLEANITLNLQLPQRSHDPHDPHQRAEPSPQA